MIRSAIVMVVAAVLTLVFGSIVILAQLLGVQRKPGGVYDLLPLWWTRSLLWLSGVRVVLHGSEPLAADAPRVYVANHVSWYDILCLVDVLPHYGFIAKRELERVPIFGPAARTVGVTYIDRENRKAAFTAYEDAARKIREGQRVIVFPEGTRGSDYYVRPFKKGPFVLAIQAGAPVVPVAIYGTIEVNPRGTLRVKPGIVHVHLLEPIPTEGLTYDDRDRLANAVRASIAAVLHREYGVPLEASATARTSRQVVGDHQHATA